MESLSETPWDVLISGTGLAQSLVALALSRSNKKVLHVDCNDYYGGADAALTLQEAEEWAGKVNALDDLQFSAASIVKPDSSLGTAKLGPPRAYSLCLSPHIVYSQSRLVPALISSQVYRQLEFQAVGSWWIYRPTKFDVVGDNEAPGTGTGSFQRVPSSREDVFADNSMGMKAKRALMKFLRFISTYSQDSDEDSIDPDSNFTSFLLSKFQVPLELHDPLLALSLSQESAQDTDAHTAVFRIQTHFRSIGVFGPGFGAVIPKWGGSAEIAQVACRAGAVGGSVYVLNRGVQAIAQSSSADNEVTEINPLIKVVLSDGEEINTRWIVGSRQDLPQTYSEDTGAQTSRSISVVSSELDHLFPQTAENGPIPAVAVVSFDGVALGLSSDASPVHLLVHSSDTGECPSGQCVIYGSTALTDGYGHDALEKAVRLLLNDARGDQTAAILWTLRYSQRGMSASSTVQPTVTRNGQTFSFPVQSLDLSFDDRIIDMVQTVWEAITEGDPERGSFLQFTDREAEAAAAADEQDEDEAQLVGPEPSEN